MKRYVLKIVPNDQPNHDGRYVDHIADESFDVWNTEVKPGWHTVWYEVAEHYSGPQPAYMGGPLI